MTDALEAERPRPLSAILTAALIAGLICGALASALQAIWVWPAIAQAETYESASAHSAATLHDHADASAPPSPFVRAALSVLTNVAVCFGYALLMAAAMVIAGRRLDWRRGLLWGAAGYTAVMLAPALGMPPMPPGVEAGALAGRQLWWIATVLCTAAGLALMLLPRRYRFHAVAAGLVLIVLPHAIGAPLGPLEGSAPIELRRHFAIVVLLGSLPPWLATGAVLGWLLRTRTP